jgi:uncharacterized membrane protein YkvA (DUF1232 family)
MEESRLSPEQLGKRVGISGMTIRRWSREPSKSEIPKFYDRAFGDAIYQLVMEGALKEDASSSQLAMRQSQSVTFESAIKTLGLPTDFLRPSQPGDQSHLMVGLSQIGAGEKRKAEVDKKAKWILSFKKMGEGWAESITVLMKVIRSKNFNTMDKLVAYGALFYLVCPFDLIPDSIPVIGYLDDYAILCLAAAYYVKRFTELGKAGHAV